MSFFFEKGDFPQSSWFSGKMLKDIANGVLVTGLIFVVSIYIPIIGFFSSLFMPLPTLFYRLKLGRTIGAAVPILAFAIMLAMIGQISVDALFFVELLLIGFVLGELVALNLPIEKTMLYACACVVLTGFLAVAAFASFSGLGIIGFVSQYVARNLQLTLELYKSMGMSEESIQLIASSLDKFQYILVRLIPALVIVATLFVAWISLLLVRPLLTRRALFYPDYGQLNLWQAPEYLVWPVIACGLLLLVPGWTLKMLATNGLLILMMVYFFQGIAIVSFYFEKKHFPRVLKIFFYSLIALQWMVLLAVIGLGFFDVWLNFRKLPKKENN